MRLSCSFAGGETFCEGAANSGEELDVNHEREILAMKLDKNPTSFSLVGAFLGMGLLILGSLEVSAQVRGNTKKKKVFRDAHTHQSLVTHYESSLEADPLRALETPKLDYDPVKEQKKPADLVEQSDIISFRGKSALIPKDAIVYVPERLSDRLRMEESSQIVGWSKFYYPNRSWIRTVEVSLAQVTGEEPLAQGMQEMMERSGKIVVATYKGGPITVLPYREPEETPKAFDPETQEEIKHETERIRNRELSDRKQPRSSDLLVVRDR